MNQSQPNRRDALRSGLGLGAIALAHLLKRDGVARGAEAAPPSPAKLKTPIRSVVVLHMGGGVSQIDSFDPKPKLAEYAGQEVPESIAALVPKGNSRLRLTNLMPSPWKFEQHGSSGLPVSELFPAMARHVDDLTVIRSMRHESPIHTPADYLTLTGSLTGQRPSLGAWLTYGLGSENQDLPAFVSMVTGDNFSGPALWGGGFLPPEHQGVLVAGNRGIRDIELPPGVDKSQRRTQLDLLRALNERRATALGGSEELDARVRSYEMAFRMQTAAPEAFDLGSETAETRRLYGLDEGPTAEFGANCLLARRLVERGVRFVQLVGAGWDAHSDIRENHTNQARQTDGPIGALLTDLKRLGLQDSTLVVWGGEFGRTPTVEGDPNKPGRDHNPAGYTMWLWGGPFQRGISIGATDELGYTAVERPVHPNDLHATLLHALGLDERAIWYEHNGRKEIVTNLGGQVVHEAFA